MVHPSFSITEKCIIDPILSMRAFPPGLVGFAAKIGRFTQSEIATRIMAVFTGVFATPDAFIHFVNGVEKGAYLLARKVCSFLPPSRSSPSEVYHHFRRAVLFGVAAIVGPAAGVIWPGVFKYFRYSPTPPTADCQNAPEALKELEKDVRDKKEASPYPRLQQFWKNASLSDKHWFVQVFGQDKAFEPVREKFAGTVFRSLIDENEDPNWYSFERIRSECFYCGEAYFHSTPTEKALESILKTKRVEVRHEKLYPGAFVSTRPEKDFGRFTLCFKSNIARLSKVPIGFTMPGMGYKTYWAGFSHDIPVIESTLAYITIDRGSDDECRSLESRCKEWAGREIPVVSLQSVANTIDSINRMDLGIPKEWPEAGAQVGIEILNGLKALAKEAVQVTVQQQQRAVLPIQYQQRQRQRVALLASN